ncbi:MAG: hypothetical protein Q8O67_26960 [Deltaproteobacteria bacterium]|nr:hypothetical protein [Deltaproteobacteria bacterium]
MIGERGQRAFVAVVFVALSGCRCSDPAAVVDAGVVAEDLTIELTPAQEQDAIALVSARVPRRTGACAQVRSIKDKAEATLVAAEITRVTGLPAELIEKDLGARGVWQRLCIGDEESAARVTARATRWTAPDGLLQKFLDPPTPNEPRFFVHEKSSLEARKPTLEQAKAFLRRSSGGDVVFAGTSARPLLAGSGEASGSQGRVVVVDVDGRLLAFDPAPPPGCASCAVAEQKSPITSRRVVAAGELLPAPGEELLVEEETGDGTRLLAVVVDDKGTLRRVGAVLLASASAGVILRGEASVVEADGDDDREVAITRLELRTSGGNLCSLDTRAEAWATPPPNTTTTRGLVKLDALALAARPEGDDAVVDLVTALDGAGDKDAASRACASVLAARPGTLVSQLCMQRVRTLVADGRLTDAVNAAGTLSEGTPALRAAVAGPLFQAMTALDQDPRLSAAPWDCQTEPLVKDMPQKSLDEVLRVARARQTERLSLVDVKDAVFVTATRDFGPETPVGQIAARWLERLRIAQPARHAAIEALLLPQAPEPAQQPDAGSDGTPGFGGSP